MSQQSILTLKNGQNQSDGFKRLKDYKSNTRTNLQIYDWIYD
jgi:hypothetical protein